MYLSPLFLSPLFLFNCFFFSGIYQADAATPQVCHSGDCVDLEVVSKQEDLERGLMYRTSLGENKGMLFVFSFDARHSFWMKNMKFSLDLVWLDTKPEIAFIAPNVPVCLKDACPVYAPDKEARYVLELNSGFCTTHGWQVGDKLDLKGLP